MAPQFPQALREGRQVRGQALNSRTHDRDGRDWPGDHGSGTQAAGVTKKNTNQTQQNP